jgi:LacI family transcriptional regulator
MRDLRHRDRPDAGRRPGRHTIPDRLFMVGYDDIDMAPYTIPPLTTISQTGVDGGRVAAELLFRMIDENLNREEVSDVILAPSWSSASRPLPTRAR